jgi:hypothetical protein
MNIANRKKAILIEFNELTPTLMDRFIESGQLPNFSKFRDESMVYETIASETGHELNPWIQWVTVHTGLDYKDHHVLHLNEGHLLNAPRLWDTTSRYGLSNWICGSMNVNKSSDFKGLMMPDPWCTEIPPSDEVKTFFRFVQKNVLEYSNDRIPMSRSEYVQVVWYLVTHGLSWNTATSILKQLISERNGRSKWKRAVLLDKLQFDIFKWFWKRDKPSFSTFFANSTAHYQHAYWQNMDPESFEVERTNPKPDEFEEAILFGYKEMDDLIGRFAKLADSDTTLIFSTAISQEPCPRYEELGGAFYRSRDFSKFLNFVGLGGFGDVQPVMTHQFHIEFPDVSKAADAAAELARYKIDGDQLLQLEQKGTRLFAGCRIYKNLDLKREITSFKSGVTEPLSSFFYRLETIKSGMHNPIGMLWIRSPNRQRNHSLAQVALKSTPGLILETLGLKA